MSDNACVEIGMAHCREPQSFAINRRSRCGSVRGSPVLNSHFSPGSAPQVGQRTARICFGLSSFFMATKLSENTRVVCLIPNELALWRDLAYPRLPLSFVLDQAEGFPENLGSCRTNPRIIDGALGAYPTVIKSPPDFNFPNQNLEWLHETNLRFLRLQ